MNVYFTGDIHGNPHELAYRFVNIPLEESDLIVILGDAGFNYYKGGRADRLKKQAADLIPCNLLCIHGNHEARPETLYQYDPELYRDVGAEPELLYHEEEFFGGKVYVEEKYPRLKFAKDGERYDIDGHTFLAIGGAYSVDKYYRLANGWTWFPDEQPNEETKAKILADAKANPTVDFVLSHTCPLSYQPKDKFIDSVNQNEVDQSTEEFLEKVKDTLSFKYWLFGHYHVNRWINKQAACFFEGVLSLDQIIGKENDDV